jgi:hypothetical protein
MNGHGRIWHHDAVCPLCHALTVAATLKDQLSTVEYVMQTLREAHEDRER